MNTEKILLQNYFNRNRNSVNTEKGSVLSRQIALKQFLILQGFHVGSLSAKHTPVCTINVFCFSQQTTLQTRLLHPVFSCFELAVTAPTQRSCSYVMHAQCTGRPQVQFEHCWVQTEV